MNTFHIFAIPETDLAALRGPATPTDRVRVRANGGEPVRCCLRDAEAGSELILANYAPEMPESPYRAHGAVFVHEDPRECRSIRPDRFPVPWQHREQALRCYDDRGWMVGSQVVPAGTLDAAIAGQFDDDRVALVHTHNVGAGCFMLRAERPVPADEVAQP